MKKANQFAKTFIAIGSIFLVATFFACNKGEGEGTHSGNGHDKMEMDGHGDHAHDGHSMKAKYKVVETGDLKASFEFSTMADHMESMKKMGMESKMDHSNMGDHHIMLTLLNKSDGKMNSDVKELSFVITGPDGKTVTKKAHVMHKDNMHHFGIDFQASGKGVYKFKAEFTHNGKKHSPEVSFEM